MSKRAARLPLWKVPFRAVYCESFGAMLKQTFWCHVVVRVFPCARDLGADALVDEYLDNPQSFVEQYKHALRQVRAWREMGARPAGS